MTTEIGILNGQAVILAADSAVSTSNKIFQSANKIFSLSKHHPVGIMVFSSAQFMGVPWETIIKCYREKLGQKKFPMLKDYCRDFLDFIVNDDTLLNNYLNGKDYILHLALEIAEDLKEFFIQGKIKGAEGEFEEFFFGLHTAIQADFENISGCIEKNIFFDVFDGVINRVFDLTVGNSLPEEEKYRQIFADIIYGRALLTFQSYTGLVFAGYGDKEVFPSLETYHVSSLLNSVLVMKRIDVDCHAVTVSASSRVIGFAQDDIISMFMNGIHPTCMGHFYRTFGNIVKQIPDLILEKFSLSDYLTESQASALPEIQDYLVDQTFDALEDTIRQTFVHPTMDTISILPPLEVANLAEAMVNLTTLQRKVSANEETVGGPTDVAIISKGDGFIWVKRKHYFDSNLNHRFLNNYYRSRENDDNRKE